ncbi:hypothetical protein BDZ91DRAFT_717070 [Kalaharituber pfeilii]|nr:hypothetical protein BDZ91DRAFT_717070 [Kalaharituber pfeilii]
MATATANVRTQRARPRLFRVVEALLQKARPPNSGPDPRANNRRSYTATFFDLLAPELQVSIFSHCSYHDLLNLRRTSRAFKELIDVNEFNIVKAMVPVCEYSELGKLFPPPRIKLGSSQEKPLYSLNYIRTLYCIHQLCEQLAYHLAQREIMPAMESFRRKEKKGYGGMLIRTVQAALIPQLYYVYYFFHNLQRRIASARFALLHQHRSKLLQGRPTAEPIILLPTYLQIQREFLSALPSKTLVTTHHCMTFLVNTIRVSVSPDPPHNQNDALVCTLLRCTSAFLRMIDYFDADSGAPSARGGGRGLRKTFMQTMQREKEVAEQQGPIMFGGPGYVPKIKETWFMAAKEELERRGLRGHEPEVYMFKGVREVRLGCQLCWDAER